MFFEGDLQSGIGAAVSQSKAVLCFVHDDGDVSRTWEEEYLEGNQETAQLIQEHTIALNIKAGSQEATYLQALYPVREAPLVIIIKNGQIADVLTKDVEREAFGERIGKALKPREEGQAAREEEDSVMEEAASSGATTIERPDGTRAPRQAAPPTFVSAPSNDTAVPEPASSPPNPASVTSGSRNSTSVPEPARSPPNTTPVLASGSSNSTSVQEQARSPPNTASVQHSSTPQEPSTPTTPSAIDNQRKEYITQQRQREAAQKAERQRIKESIEADRRERRRQAEIAKKGYSSIPNPNESPSQQTQTKPPTPTEIRLAVRLISGESIRSTFPKSSTISSTIRPWVANHLRSSTSSDVNTPYTFKLVLAPLPNRTISISEEEMTLEELLSGDETGRGRGGVNFILVPEKSSTSEAYAQMGSGTILTTGLKAIAMGYGIASSVVGGVGSLVGWGGGGGGAASTATAQGSSDSTTGTVGVQSVDNQTEATRKKKDHELYNGDGTNLLPRRPSGSKKRE